MHPMVKRTWLSVPRPVRDAVASTIDRAQGVTIPPPPVPPPTEYRIFFGPVNYAGQATRWARALETDPRVSARSMVSLDNNPFGYAVDYTVPWRTMEHSHRWHRAMLSALRDHYTHVVVEAVVPIIGGMYGGVEGGDIRRQIDAIRDAGVEVWMLGHGTDVRLPSRHRQLEPWSHYRDDEWTPFDLIERITQENLRVIEDVGAPTFVSTPGLLLDLPDAALTPVVIEPERWTNDAPVLQSRPPRVMHAPSIPITKGTHLIRPAIDRLVAEGLIGFELTKGVPNDRMPAYYAQRDILLDQFRSGDYGVAACEAMAAGRLVVSHVSDQVRREVLDRTGLEVPIVEATIDTLEDVLRDVIDDPDRYREIARRGPSFVRAVHDGTVARDAFVRHLG